MKYDFSVVQVGEKRLTGMKMRTSMRDAAKDCMALWMRFGPRLCPQSLGCELGNRVSYGVSLDMAADGGFTYWAAVELPEGAPTPEGMETFTLAGGTYVRGTAAGLEDLGPAYTAMYETWPSTQSEYAIDMQGRCFELYAENWTPAMPVDIYGGLVKAAR